MQIFSKSLQYLATTLSEGQYRENVPVGRIADHTILVEEYPHHLPSSNRQISGGHAKN
jgi:hypothetical protein